MLLLMPLAAVLAWRLQASTWNLIGRLTLYASMFGLVAWTIVLIFNGTDLTESMYDRTLNAIGVVVGAINVPLIQVISASFLFVNWPGSWKYGRNKE